MLPSTSRRSQGSALTSQSSRSLPRRMQASQMRMFAQQLQQQQQLQHQQQQQQLQQQQQIRRLPRSADTSTDSPQTRILERASRWTPVHSISSCQAFTFSPTAAARTHVSGYFPQRGNVPPIFVVVDVRPAGPPPPPGPSVRRPEDFVKLTDDDNEQLVLKNLPSCVSFETCYQQA